MLNYLFATEITCSNLAYNIRPVEIPGIVNVVIQKGSTAISLDMTVRLFLCSKIEALKFGLTTVK